MRYAPLDDNQFKKVNECFAYQDDKDDKQTVEALQAVILKQAAMYYASLQQDVSPDYIPIR